MPDTYNLKNNPFDVNRIRKTVKDQILQANADRTLAKQTYDYFFNKVKGVDPEAEIDLTSQDKQVMIESLKLMQSSRNSTTKCLDTLVKLEIAHLKEKDGEDTGFLGD